MIFFNQIGSKNVRTVIFVFGRLPFVIGYGNFYYSSILSRYTRHIINMHTKYFDVLNEYHPIILYTQRFFFFIVFCLRIL